MTLMASSLKFSSIPHREGLSLQRQLVKEALVLKDYQEGGLCLQQQTVEEALIPQNNRW